MLKFCEHEDVIFGRAPLVGVLCQFRFEPILSLLGEVGVAGFQEGLRHIYPHFRPEQIAQLQVNPGQVGLAQSAPIWRLSDDEDRWNVSLATDFVALETPRYRNFEEFLDRLFQVLDVLDRTVHPAAMTRMGLRKVNQISHPSVTQPRDWVDLLSSDLLSLLGAATPGEIALSLSDVRFRDGDTELAIRHGVAPNEPTKYLLDLDHSTLTSHRLKPEESMRQLLLGFSEAMTGFFHWVLKKKMYDWLEPVPRSTVVAR